MWYWIDTGWGCGGIKCIDDIVIEGAPIFRKLFGSSIRTLEKIYKVEKLPV